MNNIADWVAGFTEGDGSIMTRSGPSGRAVQVAYAQKSVEPLDFIMSLFGGKIKPTSKGCSYVRYGLQTGVQLILSVLMESVVSNHGTDRLNRALSLLGWGQVTPRQDISLDWLAGFWDAEGSSTDKVSVTLAQKDYALLSRIQDAYGGNIVTGDGCFMWYVSGALARELSTEIANRSHFPSKIGRMQTNLFGVSHYDKHSEKLRLRSAEWRRTHPGYFVERMHQYYVAHKEELLARSRQYRLDNLERLREYDRERSRLRRSKEYLIGQGCCPEGVVGGSD